MYCVCMLATQLKVRCHVLYNAIRVKDDEIQVDMSVLEKLQRRHIDELRPIYDIQFDVLIKEYALVGRT